MHFKSILQGLLSEKHTNVEVSFLTLLEQLLTVSGTSKQFPKILKKITKFFVRIIYRLPLRPMQKSNKNVFVKQPSVYALIFNFESRPDLIEVLFFTQA